MGTHRELADVLRDSFPYVYEAERLRKMLKQSLPKTVHFTES